MLNDNEYYTGMRETVNTREKMRHTGMCVYRVVYKLGRVMYNVWLYSMYFSTEMHVLIK